MKRSYKKLLYFEITVLLLLIINIFRNNIINNYLITSFLLILIIIFKKIFGVEKIKKRYTKDLIIDLSIVYIIFFVIYYLFGLITGFYKINNYFTIYGIVTFIIPNTLIVIFKEYFRFLVYTKTHKSKILNISTLLMLILIDLINILKISNLSSIQSIFYLCALSIIPVIVNNIVANYIIKKSNYKINVFWLLVINLYVYVFPIIPNVGDYILSIIKIILPLIIYYRVNNFYENMEDKEIERDYNKKYITPYIFAGIITIVLVYFSSGYFRYQTIAIASGSMVPYFSKGDVVVVDKKFDEIKVGDVIAYKYKDVIVVHRLIKKIEKDKVFYYTKGDANNLPDNYVVNEEDIVGIVDGIIPYLGLPAVWLNGL